MAWVVGAVLAVAAGLLGTVAGLERDRAFYPTATIVVASYYALFAVMGASTQVLMLESLMGSLFLAAAVAGFRSSLWIVAAALAAHGILDVAHDRVLSNPGVPPWWPAFCCAFDLIAAVYLAGLLKAGRVRAAA